MLRYMTAGESHGEGIVAILDGVPAGLVIDEAFINRELTRRMGGYGRGKRMTKIEEDKIKLIAGCRKGRTIGSPVCMIVHNRDKSIDKFPVVTNPRPGHADLAGLQKYGFSDVQDVLERASARETAGRVAAGAVAKLMLGEFGIRVLSHVTMVGGINADTVGLSFDDILKRSLRSKIMCADKKASELMCAEIDKADKAGDTLGGAFEVIVADVPPGLGSYTQWDRRLDGDLARAVMAIPAVKAVAIGGGIGCAGSRGHEAHDEIRYDAARKMFIRATNNAGGIEGGITNGENLVVRGFMKPIASLKRPLGSVDIRTKKAARAAAPRSDVTAVAACGVVAEGAVAIEVASAFILKFGGDSMDEARRNYKNYMAVLKKI